MPADPGTGGRRIVSSPRPKPKPPPTPKRKPKRPDETIGSRYVSTPTPERKPKRPPEGTGAAPPKKTVPIPRSLVTGMPFAPAPGTYVGPRGTHSALGPPSGPVGGKKDRPEVTFRARPDIEDRRSILEAGGMAGKGGGARKQNMQRGAKTSGGPGTKEIDEFTRVANRAAANPTGQHITELQRNLRKQGFDVAVDGVWGPKSHRALLKAQGVMGKTAKIEYKRKVKRVLADPGSHPEEMVEIFGFKGAQKLSAAWRHEAQERLLAAQAAKPDDPDFLDKWAAVSRSLPGLVGGTIKGVAAGAATAGVEAVMGAAYEPPRPGQAPGLNLPAGARGALAGLTAQERTAEALTIGVDLAAYLKGDEYDETGLKIDLALAPLLIVGRPIQGLRAAGAVMKAAKAGKRGEELADLASKTYRGAGILKSRRMKQQEAKRVRSALTANGEISQAIIKDVDVPLPKGLTAAHDRSLKKARDLEVKVKDREDAGRGDLPEEDYEKELKDLKATRKEAYADETYQRLRAIFPDHVLDRFDEKFAARANVSKTLAKQLKGKPGALPAGANTEHKIQQLFTFLDALIDEGMDGRKWYENSAKAILAVTKGDKVQAERLAQLFAIYSPQQPIIGNTSLAIRAWNQFHGPGGKIATGTADQIKKATEVMNGGSFEGRKTNNFYVNFLEDINPEEFRRLVDAGEIREKGVTVDMWMARVFGYKSDQVAKRRYDFMEMVMQHLADERGAGWKPKQVQAAIWTAIKHHALTDTSANIDFSDSVVRHYGSFSWTAQPGSEADQAFVALYESWPDHVKAMLHHGYAELADQFLGELHLLTQRSDIGPMVRDTDEGLEIASLAQTEVMTSAAPRPTKTQVKGYKAEGDEPAQYMYYVHPDEQAALDFAAAAMGKAFQIPNISWSRMSEPISKGHANVRWIKIGRDATDEEVEAVWHAVNPDGQERVRVQHGVNGLILTNVSEDLANIGTKNSPQFREMAEAAAKDVFKELKGKGSIGGYASHTRELESGEYGVHLRDGHTGGAGRDGRAIEAAVRLEGDAQAFRTRLATAFPPKRLDPPELPRADAPAAGLAHANTRAVEATKAWQHEIAGGMPPVPAGHIRLYRGEGEGFMSAEEQGLIPGDESSYWSADPEVAESFESGGGVHYVDVPKVKAKEYLGEAGNYELPGTIAAGAKPFTDEPLRRGEPPVPAGRVRLYRGEPVMPPKPPPGDRTAWADYKLNYPVVPKRGTYFSPDRATAENFARNANNGYPGELLYVDVPKADLAEGGARSQYTLSEEVAAQAQPVHVADDEAVIRAAQETLGIGSQSLSSGLPYSEALTDPTKWTTLRTHALDVENAYAVRYGETLSGRKVQLPQGRSTLESFGVKAMDWASRKADDIPVIHDSFGIRYVTMHDRSVGALGREQRFEIDLGRAEMSPEIKTISQVVPDSDKDFAHSWWQQMPEDLRSNDGLRAVQGKQREYLAYLMSPKAVEDIQRQRRLLVMQDKAADSVERYNQIEREIRDMLKREIAEAEAAAGGGAKVAHAQAVAAREAPADEKALMARAVELDNRWEKQVETISESLFGKPVDRGKAETAKRNAERARLARKGIQVLTVKRENFLEAEKRVLAFLEQHAEDPRFSGVLAEIAERERIAQDLAAAADRKLGGVDVAAHAPEVTTVAGDSEEVAALKEMLASRPAYEDIVADKKSGRITDELQRLDNMEDDIPLKKLSTEASIARLQQVIDAEVKPDPKLFAALRRLSEDRTKTLIEAGAVTPERAEARRGLISRWLGVESDGSEIYFGHRMPDPTDPVSSYGGTGGVGRVKGPAGAGTRNRQALINSGRSHMSVVVAYQDWEKSRAFKQALTNRENIYSFSTENWKPGRKIDPKTEILVNPKGRIIPAWWKVGDLSQFTDNPEDAADLRALAHEMTKQWLGDFEDVSDYTRWISEATTGENAVDPTDLMIVNRRDVDHYYAQFKAPGQGKRGGTRIYDRLVDATALALVVLRLGYIPKNIVQNTIMAFGDQGPMLLVNAVRAAQVIVDPELKRIMKRVGRDITEAEINESRRFRAVVRNFAGSGQFAAVGREQASKGAIPLPRGRKLEARAVLGFIRGVADDPARMSSFLHEAAARGVFGPAYKKVVPWFTHEDRKALIELWENPRHRELLRDIAYGGTEGMGNFARMNPTQARQARRILVVPSWLLAGTRLPFMFARNHPIRSMLIAYMALGDPADKVPDDLWFEKPAWTYIEGTGYKQGIDTAYGRLRTSSINPVSMPWEMGQAIYGTLKGGQSPWDFESKAAWDMANPLMASIITMLAGEGRPADLPFTDWDLPSAGELGRVLPQAKQIYQMITGDVSNAGYPAEETRMDVIRRELGIIPLHGLDEEGGSDEGGGEGGDFWGGSEGGGGGGDSFWEGEGSESFWGNE